MPGVRDGNLRLAGRFGASVVERVELPLMERERSEEKGSGELLEAHLEMLLDTLSRGCS